MKAFFSSQTKQFILYLVIIIATLWGLWLVYLLRDVLSLVLLSCFAALLLSPFVTRLNKWWVHQVPAILTTFLGLLVILGLFIVSIIPIFVRLAEDSKAYVLRSIDFIETQAQNEFPFIDALPFRLWTMIRKGVDIPELTAIVLDHNRVQLVTENIVNNIDTLKNFAQDGIGQVGNIGVSFASGLTSFITLFSLFLLLTFFILLERRAFLKWFFAILPHQLGHYFKSREHTIGDAIHAWLRWQLTLAVFMFTINFIGLAIAQFFGLPVTNIFSLALIAGAMEFVPYVGPVIAFIPTFLMVLVSPDVGMWSIVAVIGLYILFQQLEGNIMVPLVMSRTLRLSSLYILIVTLIGATLGGPLGVILAIPLASIIHIFYHDWMHYRKTLEQ